ncbi:MAG TPA: histidine kinase dimerization/phospho-acceptor domain-containing protein [Stellaceae bacterium]|nr:histidine kinase dimerization/phospho-acceptor domain-containing protein [Stellaceae bacterium]
MARLDRHEPFRDFVYQLRVEDGSLCIISVSGNPVFDASGRFLGYRGTGRDITHPVRAEEALRQAKEEAEAANRTKSHFLANMSHELRIPLNAIIGFSEIIRDQLVGPVDARYARYGFDIHTAGQHLLRLIGDVLDLSKIEVGRLELREEVVSLGEIIDSSLRLVQERATNGGVALERALPGELPLLRVDALRLKQVVLNVLSNAVKFTPSGGCVRIAVEDAAEGGLVIAVTDTGIGMRRQDIATALTPFSQLDSGLNRRHEGTGLGPAARQDAHRAAWRAARDRQRARCRHHRQNPSPAIVLALAGCASNQLTADLSSAHELCRAQHFHDKLSLVRCLNERERPVWAKEDPGTLDLFGRFAAERTEFARRYDGGALTAEQYQAELRRIEAGTRAQLAERRGDRPLE